MDTDNQIIAEGIQQAVDKGLKIGHLKGQADMLTEVQQQFSDKITHVWVNQRFAKIKAELEAMAGQEEAKQ